jgi:hypothetical protein
MSFRSNLAGLTVTAMVVGVAGVAGFGCDALLGESGSDLLSGAACPQYGSGSALGVAYSGKASVDAEIGAFVQASGDIRAGVRAMRENVGKACIAIGRDIGLTADQLAPGDDKVSKPCGAVAAKIDAMLAASADAKMEISITPPKCEVDAGFRAKCEAECGIEVEPAKVVATCEPAKLSGQCVGTCSGQCEGTCKGECKGECTAKDAQGNCVGECKGECHGECSATCHAKCEGEWKAPHCEVDVEPGSAKAECQGNCSASAKFRATCEPARVEVKSSASAMEIQKLKLSLQRNLPALATAQIRLSRDLAGDVKIVARAGKRLQGQLKGAGGKAVACVAAAVSGMAEATVSINVTVKASASVSGSASGKASAG